jgi:small nuclear ribonucleoprotein D2
MLEPAFVISSFIYSIFSPSCSNEAVKNEASGVDPSHEQEELSKGPLSVLMKSVKNNTQVLINLRNNHKLLGQVRAFDRHCNMVLENVKELWTEVPVSSGKRGRPIPRDRVISKLFLRGDSVIVVVSGDSLPKNKE